MKRSSWILSSCLTWSVLFGLCPHSAQATIYEVGPNQPIYKNIGDIPWRDVGPGDEVRIHWRSEPYREKIYLSQRGTPSQHIVIRGLPGPRGKLPIVSGENATSSPNFEYPSDTSLQAYGLVFIGPSTENPGRVPGYIDIQNLVLTKAYENYSFKAINGETWWYIAAAGGVYIQYAENITIQGCLISDNGNGIFANSNKGLTQDLVIRGNYIYGNGTICDWDPITQKCQHPGHDRHHNTYIEAVHVTYEYNRYGPVREDSAGIGLKDRSAGTVVRYNYFLNGKFFLDLVEPESNYADGIINDAQFAKDYVYGNIFIQNPDISSVSNRLFRYGGESDVKYFRKGTLQFYDNTVLLYSKKSTQYYVTMFKLDSNEQSLNITNNIFLNQPDVISNASEFNIMTTDTGNLTVGKNNWISPWWQLYRYPEQFTGQVQGLENLITNEENNPGFKNLSKEDLHLAPESQAIDQAGPLNPGVPPVSEQYVYHQQSEARASAKDLGAFEHFTTQGTLPVITQQPASSTVIVGQTATFSIIASGTPPLNYQWTRNRQNIPNAIFPTYTTPHTTKEDNGAQYHCRVSNSLGSVTSDPATLTVTVPTCLPGGDQYTINGVLLQPGDKAVLCQNALFNLTGTVMFSEDNQQIYTEGFPKDDTRAVLRITSSSVVTAILGSYRTGVEIRNIIVDGNRPSYGFLDIDNSELITLGGDASRQVVDHVKAFEPRGWSTLFVFEGSGLCSEATITNNDLGPSGQPTDGPGVADGISLACARSLVSGNVINDATDGAIVIFQAPGSTVTANTIRAKTRLLQGAIAMVDYDSYKGDYSGTVVASNTIMAVGAAIQIGIAMGTRIWYCPDPDDPNSYGFNELNFGGSVVNNTLTGPWMGYGYPANGVKGWTVLGNVSYARHSGIPVNCLPGSPTPDPPQAFQKDMVNAQGTFQSEYVNANYLASLVGVKAIPLPPGTDNSLFVSQSVPSVMEAGKTYPVSIALKNISDLTWSAASGYELGSQNPKDNLTWGVNRIALNSGESIAPGQAKTFVFNVIAPGRPGNYIFEWGMVHKDQPFGDFSDILLVTVTGQAGNAPTITQDPQNQTVDEGQPASFSVQAQGTPPLFFQWFKNSALISGATQALHTTPPTTLADNGSTFYVRVSNDFGNVFSASATLIVRDITPPSVPSNLHILARTSSTISLAWTASTDNVRVEGYNLDLSTNIGFLPFVLGYQNKDVGNATSTIASGLLAGTSYYARVRARDTAGNFSLYSNVASTMTLAGGQPPANGTPPSITQQPGSTTVAVGQKATFSVAATGTPPLYYQWQKQPPDVPVFIDIAGATTSTYTISSTSSTDNGSQYRCRVSNPLGSVVSNAATLTVFLQYSITVDEKGGTYGMELGKLLLTIVILPNTFFSPQQVLVSAVSSFPDPNSFVAKLEPTYFGAQIDVPVQPALDVTLKFSRMSGLDMSKPLIVARHDPTHGVWLLLPSVVQNDAVVAQTDHFSLFEIMLVLPSARLDNAKVFPNPLRPSQGHTAMTFSSLPPNARIRIYTLLGELVRELSANGAGMALWDGANQAGQKAASGLYFALAEAEQDKKILKLAIQR